MDAAQPVRISRFLARHLRHDPGAVGAWRAGIRFYRATKGEYLADAVPPRFLCVVDGV